MGTKTNDPTVYVHDDLITPHLVALAGSIECALDAAHLVTCQGGLVAGDFVDATAIGESGSMWWVRLITISHGFAQEGARGISKKACAAPMTVSVGVGYLTCYPIDSEGRPMSTNQHLTTTSEVHAAMMALRHAMLCSDLCPDWTDGARGGLGDIIPGTWTPMGPDGGAVGGEWLLTFEVIRKRPAETPEP